MRYCTNCGTQISLDAKFCINCGMHLKQESYDNQNFKTEQNKNSNKNITTKKKSGIFPWMIFLILVVPIDLVLVNRISDAIGPHAIPILIISLFFLFIACILTVKGFQIKKSQKKTQISFPIKFGSLVFLLASVLLFFDSIEVKELPNKYNEGVKAFKAEQWGRAIRLFSEIQSIDPNYKDTQRLIQEGKTNRAKKIYISAKSTFENAKIDFSKKKYSASIDSAKKVISILKNTKEYNESVTLLAEAEQFLELAKKESKSSASTHTAPKMSNTPAVRPIGSTEERLSVAAAIRHYMRDQNIPVAVTAIGTELTVHYKVAQIDYAPETFFRQQGREGLERIANAGFATLVIEARDSSGRLQKKVFPVAQYRTNAPTPRPSPLNTINKNSVNTGTASAKYFDGSKACKFLANVGGLDLGNYVSYTNTEGYTCDGGVRVIKLSCNPISGILCNQISYSVDGEKEGATSAKLSYMGTSLHPESHTKDMQTFFQYANQLAKQAVGAELEPEMKQYLFATNRFLPMKPEPDIATIERHTLKKKLGSGFVKILTRRNDLPGGTAYIILFTVYPDERWSNE